MIAAGLLVSAAGSWDGLVLVERFAVTEDRAGEDCCDANKDADEPQGHCSDSTYRVWRFQAAGG